MGYKINNREEFFEELLDLFEKHIEATDVRTENEYKEMILEFIQKRDIDLAYDLPHNYNPGK